MENTVEMYGLGEPEAAVSEKQEYLTRQLITYLGNKRALLEFIGRGLERAAARLGKHRLKIFDVFSGSGIVSRYLKRFSELLLVNDIEKYSQVINTCYLANETELDVPALRDRHAWLCERLAGEPLREGFIAELYAPRDDRAIRPGERVFYTRRNARFLDTARLYIQELPERERPFFLAPLLTEASIHANTAGVFKGFYKNTTSGLGQFGGTRQDALSRITGDISLPFPVFSNFPSEVRILRGDANRVCLTAEEVDLAYLDPPYNQHPYGSNYFMLNLLTDYVRPEGTSRVSGIPSDWNRSDYNKSRRAPQALRELLENIKARFLLLSFNSEGFVKKDELRSLLQKIGSVELLETKYNTFRGSRNLKNREVHVKEYLFLIEKK